jgi:hypothetical protein
LKSRDTQRLTAAFELKWVSEGPFDKQRVVDDLLRLEALRITERQHVYRYFVTVQGGGSSRPLALDRTQTVALISVRDSLRCFLHLLALAILTGRRHRLRCGRYWSS